MTRTTRTARLALAGLALAGALTACGDSSSDDPTLASSPGTAAGESASPGSVQTTCPVEAKSAPASGAVSKDLGQKPAVPAAKGTPPTDVLVTDIVTGSGPEATAGSQVAVKYVGALDKDGKEFDASWGRPAGQDTLPYTVCGQEVVAGFSVAPLGMKVGGRRLVRIPPDYGYGAQGQPAAGIGGTDVISFVIDLVSVQ